MNKSKIFKITAAVGVLVVLLVYIKFFTSNTTFDKEEVYVEIPTGSKYDEVQKIISPYVTNMSDFEFIAQLRSYPDNVKPGRFLLKKGMSAFQLVSAMRRNVPVKLAFNNQERLENLCERISSQIEPDTTKLLATFRDSIFLQKNGFTKETVFAMFLPNTYEFYWNVSAEKFRDKMLEEYNRFWTKERLAKATELNMTPVQVITLASIVHKETVKKSERPTVAGVYLNRLKDGMKLQADPTVIYALKLRDNDFEQVIKRVLYNDLFIASPYNTYQNEGLPPGPIAMPDIDAIDAVLNAEKHNYLYFCASVERFGYHEFAATMAQHDVNAKKYADWLNAQGTKR
ncbi:MAG: endolytic transglycosylase MltG [Flavobacterium sp.]|uniref:Endolytic murein transglycosylase n=1 Tax=Flavobacterium cheonhonense TaxID=706185 RepID=A0ABP7U7A7_9FLAO|nr:MULTISPECIES: endolytic transglycosylase MltG [Flavobacterium]MBA4134638.1 endolytic transglycosylase MltG [Flavobacterium sp.]PJE42247.1 MAG: endolytic transglycosylase MltG [Flavobacterium sp.] [Flavobacterium sp. FEMGT703F]